MKTWLVLALLLLAPMRAFGTVGWIGGAETGDTKECTQSSGAITADTVTVRSGNYSWKMPSGSYCETGAGSVNFIRFWFYPTAYPSIITRIWNWGNDFACTVCGRLNITTGGILTFSNVNSTAIATGTNAVPLNQWNSIELHVVGAGAGADGMSAVLNGVQEFSSFTSTLSGAQFFRFGPTDGGGQAFYYDDMSTATTAPARFNRIIARQGTAGSPVDTGFTLSGCSTIQECWSETPFSETKKTTSTTANSVQTMLVASFRSTQTGHGTETLTDSDRVDAINIIDYDDFSTSALSHRRRINGGAATTYGIQTCTGAQAWMNTLNQQWFHGMAGCGITTKLFSDTLANVDGYEIGVTHTNDASNLVVADVWLMVEYCQGCLAAGFGHKIRQN